MNAPNKLEVPQEVIEFKLNGNTVEAFDGESILNAAKRAGVRFPTFVIATACVPTVTAAPAWSK